MSKFDDFVDEFIFMAKNAADVASRKTSEIVESNKVRYQLKQLEWEIEKAYAKLGAIYYESRRSNDNFDEIIQLAISSIDDLKSRYEESADTMRIYQNVMKCKECGNENNINSSFCSTCGSSLGVQQPDEKDQTEEDFEVYEAPVEIINNDDTRN